MYVTNSYYSFLSIIFPIRFKKEKNKENNFKPDDEEEALPKLHPVDQFLTSAVKDPEICMACSQIIKV